MSTQTPVGSPSPKRDLEADKGRKRSIGAFGISLSLHLSVFMLVGSYVLIDEIEPRNPPVATLLSPQPTEEYDPLPEEPKIPEPTPPMTDPTAVDAGGASQEEFSPVHAIPSSHPNATYVLPPPGMPTTALPSRGLGTGTGPGEGTGHGPGSGVATPSLFGDPKPLPGMLEGTMYDLKQDRRRKATGMNQDGHNQLLRSFYRADWNPSHLRRFYEVENRLYQSIFFLPRMNADTAPSSFGVADIVEPRMWIIIYRGNVVAPFSGEFRFVGYGDDNLAVRFNNVDVFDGSRPSIGIHGQPSPMAQVEGHHVEKSHIAANGWLAYGTWIQVERGKQYPVEILIGENPGGVFCAFLLIEEKGKSYRTGPAGRPVLPLFRTRPADRAAERALTDGPGNNALPFARDEIIFEAR